MTEHHISVTRADYETADREIRSHARAAADFGCQVVKLSTGDRLICDGRSVVTVLARHQGIYCVPGFVL